MPEAARHRRLALRITVDRRAQIAVDRLVDAAEAEAADRRPLFCRAHVVDACKAASRKGVAAERGDAHGDHDAAAADAVVLEAPAPYLRHGQPVAGIGYGQDRAAALQVGAEIVVQGI